MGKGHQHHHKKNDKKQVDTLEPILKEFREDQGTDNSGAQWVTYFVMGALTTASIVHLFSTPLLAVATPHVGILIVTVIVGALLLAVSYNEISQRKRLSLISTRELISKDVKQSDFNAAIQSESTMYALFTTNASYLFGALTFAFYVLPTYGLGEGIACGIAAIIPAAFLFGVAKSGIAF